MNQLQTQTMDVEKILSYLEKSELPESKLISSYVVAMKNKDIVALGTDEAFALVDSDGQIKAFKSTLTLSAQNGGLIQPVPGGPFVISAQGYEIWSEKTGASVIFPKEVLVGNQWMPNPHLERDPNTKRPVAVHARAVAFKYSSMGIPQVSDWTTIFDIGAYRLIDLLGKAKKLPQAFRLLPNNVTPPESEKATWAKYPFDESTSLWVNTSHDEAIVWYSQILNREKKAMDFAQTFAKRNALKHLSGLQKAPSNIWTIPVLAWRPTGNNVVKWDATQYAQLQKRVGGMISNTAKEFQTTEIEFKTGSEHSSDEVGFENVEANVDPEDTPEVIHEHVQTSVDNDHTVQEPEPVSKETMQAVTLSKSFPDEYQKAVTALKVENYKPEDLPPVIATEVCRKISEILDMDNK